MASSCFLFWALFICSKWKQQRNMGFVIFLQAHFALFLRERIHLWPYFFSGSSAHDAHTIFVFYAINLLVVLATGVLLHWSSLFYVVSHSLAATQLLLFTRWSLLSSRYLLVLLATHCSRHLNLLGCRCPLNALSYLESRLFLFRKRPQLRPSGSLYRAQPLIATSKPSRDKILV